MYACGLRTGEAVSLEIPAIDGREHLLTIIGKGNKERLVPLPDPMLWSLRHLWQLHKNPRWLFPNRAIVIGEDRQRLNARQHREMLDVAGVDQRPSRLQERPAMLH
jgi:site-specific recombinase XerC